ncbi:MAG: hypothetical protein AAF557_08850 [Pseudomonadota bacterium]
MSFLKDVRGHLKRGAKNVEKTAKKAKSKIDKATAPIDDLVEDAFEKAVDGTKTTLRETGDFAKDRAEGVGDFVEKVADSKPVERIKDAGEFIGDGLKEIGGNIGEAIEPIARPVGDGFKELGIEIKRFADEAAEKGMAFVKDKIDNNQDFQRSIAAIKNHGRIINALGNTHELMKDKEVRKEIFGDVVNPIRRNEVRGVDAQQKIDGLATHPAMAELMEAGEDSDYDGWCISLGGVLDVPGLGVGGQAAGGVLLAPARVYGALSWSLGMAVGINADVQIGFWFRKV